MRELKIIFTGASGSGKTTAISTLSETPVLSVKAGAKTGVVSNSSAPLMIDSGEILLEGGQKIKLFSTPEQDRDSSRWEFYPEGTLGIAILIDNASSTPLEMLDFHLQQLSSTTPPAAIVIGVTHTDQSNCPSMELYHQFMRERKLSYPLFPVDARRGKDVNVLIEAMMAMIQVA